MRCGKFAIKQCLIEHGKGLERLFVSDSLVEGDRGVGDQKKRGQERAESRNNTGWEAGSM